MLGSLAREGRAFSFLHICIKFINFAISIICSMTTEEIILFFCNQTGLDPTTIYNREKNDNIWHTRYMIWHYLHHTQGMSATKLSKLFDRNRPSIFRGLRVFRNHLQFHSEVRKEYYGIVKKLEGIVNTTPSENME